MSIYIPLFFHETSYCRVPSWSPIPALTDMLNFSKVVKCCPTILIAVIETISYQEIQPSSPDIFPKVTCQSCCQETVWQKKMVDRMCWQLLT